MSSVFQSNKDNDRECLMSWTDFIDYSKDFIEISNKLNDGWAFCGEIGDVNAVGESYLMKKVVKQSGCGSLSNEKDECDDEGVDVAENGDGDGNITCWEYHILYSVSYGVPVLYFNAWKRDGSILFVNDFIKESESQENDGYCSRKTCVISQQGHPLLHRPFYYIHPCDSVSVLRSCGAISQSTNSKRANPLTTWLSTIAPVVNIDLPTSYATIR